MSDAPLEQVISENEAPLLRYAWRFLKDESRAQDAVQEAFIRYSRAAAGTIFNPKAWLYRAVRNQCLNMIRKYQRKQEISLEYAAPATAGKNHDPASGIIHDECRDIIMRGFAGLGVKYREVMTLKMEHGKSYKEIAELMNTSVSNVGFMLHTAMKQLKQHYVEEASR